MEHLIHQKFGIREGGLLGTIMKHLDSVSRDTGMMRILGPDIDRTFVEIKNTVLAAGRKATGDEPLRPSILKATKMDKAEAAVKGSLFKAGFENLHLYFKNQLGQPGSPFWARTFSNLRQVLTSSYLGSASIVALTDFNWQRITNQWNGLPAFKSARRTLQLYKEGLLKKDKEMSKLAIRAAKTVFLISTKVLSISGPNILIIPVSLDTLSKCFIIVPSKPPSLIPNFC